MDEFNFDPDEVYTVNVQEVISNRNLMPLTRKLAKKIQSDEYITIAEFINDVGDEELENLVDMAADLMNEKYEEVTESAQEFVLLSMLLALGEGLEQDNSNVILHRANFLSKLVLFESLYRKGFINAFHENWTLDLDEENDNVLIESIPGITPTSEEFRKMMGNDLDDQ